MLNGEVAYNIREAKCGFSANAVDYKSLSEKLIHKSVMDNTYISKLGENGLRYYVEKIIN